MRAQEPQGLVGFEVAEIDRPGAALRRQDPGDPTEDAAPAIARRRVNAGDVRWLALTASPAATRRPRAR